MNPRRGGWLVALTVVASIVLAVVRVPPAPEWLGWVRPDWGVVVFFYWAVHAPGRVGIVWAWLAGIAFDVLLNKPLGLHGMGLAVATYLAIRFQARLAMYRLAQQTAALAAVCAGVGMLKALVLLLMQPAGFLWTASLSGVGAVAAYPLLYLIAHPLRVRWVRA